MWWHSWLSHCTKSWKVAVSIPYGVRISHCHNPSGRTMAVKSTYTLTEMSTFLGDKDGRCLGLTTLPHSCADCHEIWEIQPPGTLRSCPDLYRFCFTFTHNSVLLLLHVIYCTYFGHFRSAPLLPL